MKGSPNCLARDSKLFCVVLGDLVLKDVIPGHYSLLGGISCKARVCKHFWDLPLMLGFDLNGVKGSSFWNGCVFEAHMDETEMSWELRDFCESTPSVCSLRLADARLWWPRTHLPSSGWTRSIPQMSCAMQWLPVEQKTRAAFLEVTWLTASDMKSARNLQAEAGNFPFCTIDPNMGKAKACWLCCMSQAVWYAWNWMLLV